jgi:hypothetical protein
MWNLRDFSKLFDNKREKFKKGFSKTPDKFKGQIVIYS